MTTNSRRKKVVREFALKNDLKYTQALRELTQMFTPKEDPELSLKQLLYPSFLHSHTQIMPCSFENEAVNASLRCERAETEEELSEEDMEFFQVTPWEPSWNADEMHSSYSKEDRAMIRKMLDEFGHYAIPIDIIYSTESNLPLVCWGHAGMFFTLRKTASLWELSLVWRSLGTCSYGSYRKENWSGTEISAGAKDLLRRVLKYQYKGTWVHEPLMDTPEDLSNNTELTLWAHTIGIDHLMAASSHEDLANEFEKWVLGQKENCASPPLFKDLYEEFISQLSRDMSSPVLTVSCRETIKKVLQVFIENTPDDTPVEGVPKMLLGVDGAPHIEWVFNGHPVCLHMRPHPHDQGHKFRWNLMRMMKSAKGVKTDTKSVHWWFESYPEFPEEEIQEFVRRLS